MGRYARIIQPGLIYHVINRGNNKEIVFVEEEDYRHYLNTIQRYKKKYGFKLFAYCLMTYNTSLNSDHWLRCENVIKSPKTGGQNEEEKDLFKRA